jgi:two-component system, NarL family, nitrate/nitrite response regulator NarL
MPSYPRGATLDTMSTAVTLDKVRVVVADDHPRFREGIVRALCHSGSVDVVGQAEDGAAALELIKAHRPDVALLDYRMPAMDGAQVAEAVRRGELQTQVLLISAHGESEIMGQATRQGVAGFLSKELARTDIVQAVVECAHAPKCAHNCGGEGSKASI